jgi:hypothetical protein
VDRADAARAEGHGMTTLAADSHAIDAGVARSHHSMRPQVNRNVGRTKRSDLRMRCRSSCLAGLVFTTVACRAAAPTVALGPLAVPMRAEVRQLAIGVDSVRLAVGAVLRNPFPDTLTVETTCGIRGLRVEFADGAHWRPVLDGLTSRACGLMYSEVRVAPGDSTVLSDEVSGTRAARVLGVRWVAPLPGRYRLVITASRCVRHTRRDCWVSLVSTPFDVRSSTGDAGPDSGVQ